MKEAHAVQDLVFDPLDNLLSVSSRHTVVVQDDGLGSSFSSNITKATFSSWSEAEYKVD